MNKSDNINEYQEKSNSVDAIVSHRQQNGTKSLDKSHTANHFKLTHYPSCKYVNPDNRIQVPVIYIDVLQILF